MANVFSRRGGTKSGKDGNMHPAMVERLALGMGMAVRQAKVRCGVTVSINFRELVAEEVKRSGATHHLWSNKIMLEDVYYKMFHKMHDETVAKYIKHLFKAARRLEGAAKLAKQKEISLDWIQLCLFLLIGSLDGLCPTHDEFEEAARDAKLDRILQNKTLGGDPTWSVSTFMDNDKWDKFGELDGIGRRVWHALRVMSCIEHDVPEDEWVNYKYDGRSGLKRLKPNEQAPHLSDSEHEEEAGQPASDDSDDSESHAPRTPPKKAPPSRAKAPRRGRGIGDADVQSLGLQQSYYNKLRDVERSFSGSPFDKVKGMLSSKTGVAGEQGGKMLGAYLVSVHKSAALRPSLFDAEESAADFLASQQQVLPSHQTLTP